MTRNRYSIKRVLKQAWRALIIGGPELIPGRSYVLFLGSGDLPGAANVLTVRDHCQAVFDIEPDKSGFGRRAISQAKGQLLLPDDHGISEVPGGREGIPVDVLKQSIKHLAVCPTTPSRSPLSWSSQARRS